MLAVHSIQYTVVDSMLLVGANNPETGLPLKVPYGSLLNSFIVFTLPI